MSSVTFKEILDKYNDSVSSVRDLENALSTLIGKAEWEDSVLSDKRRSIQVLYTELKIQRNKREALESNLYQIDSGLNSVGTQTDSTGTSTSVEASTETEEPKVVQDSEHKKTEKELHEKQLSEEHLEAH